MAIAFNSRRRGPNYPQLQNPFLLLCHNSGQDPSSSTNSTRLSASITHQPTIHSVGPSSLEVHFIGGERSFRRTEETFSINFHYIMVEFTPSLNCVYQSDGFSHGLRLDHKAGRQRLKEVSIRRQQRWRLWQFARSKTEGSVMMAMALLDIGVGRKIRPQIRKVRFSAGRQNGRRNWGEAAVGRINSCRTSRLSWPTKFKLLFSVQFHMRLFLWIGPFYSGWKILSLCIIRDQWSAQAGYQHETGESFIFRQQRRINPRLFMNNLIKMPPRS